METEKLKNPALIAYPHGNFGTLEFIFTLTQINVVDLEEIHVTY